MDGYRINKNCAITGSMLAKAKERSGGRSQRPAVESDSRPLPSRICLPSSGVRPPASGFWSLASGSRHQDISRLSRILQEKAVKSHDSHEPLAKIWNLSARKTHCQSTAGREKHGLTRENWDFQNRGPAAPVSTLQPFNPLTLQRLNRTTLKPAFGNSNSVHSPTKYVI